MRLSGKPASEITLDRERTGVKSAGEAPRLAIISAGHDAASAVYMAKKLEAAERCGIYAEQIPLDADAQGSLLRFAALEASRDFDGVIIQFPLPDHLMSAAKGALDLMRADADVDGLSAVNRGNWWNADGQKPCTAAGVIRLLDYYDIPIARRRVTVIGRSDLVGKPLAAMLTMRNATVTLCHSKTENLAECTQESDIVIAAAGVPELIDEHMINSECTLVDVGINRVDGHIVGDCTREAYEKAEHYTPVPGGVGLMTVAMLMENTYEAFLRRRGNG